jgi:vacuolar protein sorting-associated protein 41
MAEGEGSKEPDLSHTTPRTNGDFKDATTASTPGQETGEDAEEEDDDEEEPRLKYATISKRLSSVYRNGDAVSAFLVAGDKMVRMTAQG